MRMRMIVTAFMTAAAALALQAMPAAGADARDVSTRCGDGPAAVEQAALNALAGWIAFDAPPGWEELASPVLAAALPGWERDTAGRTALLLALEEIDPDRLPRKVIFAWTVQEEVGLVGARALADRYGPTIRTAYAVDTFVSSDSPLESRRYAYTLLGKGPVFRGLDAASVSKPLEMDRIDRAAREAGIPLQRGASGGSTDGAPFMRYGALYAGLSWSGRHSHSPVEVLDLNDLRDLGRLIAAVAKSPLR